MKISFRDSVCKTIEKYTMLNNGDHVTVALSGGADSVALLLVLLQAAPNRQWSIDAIHVNHGLRGVESDRDEQYCRTLCHNLGVPLFVKRVDVKTHCREHKKLTTEMAARALRYEALESSSKGKIATAHTLSDSVETMLLNLSRGTGLDGMRGIPPVRGRIIRPLIEQSRPQIEAFCQQCSCPYVTDSSNACLEYSRNRLRSQVVPVLKSINPAFENAAGRLMRLAACDADYLEKSANHMMDEALESVGLNIDLIENLHPALRTRVIRMFLGQAGHRCDEQTVLRADRIVQAKRGRMQLPDGSLLAVSRGFLKYDVPASYSPGHSRRISLSDIQAPIGVRLSDDRWLTLRPLSLRDIKLFVNYIPLEFKNVVDCDRINHSLQLRGRKPKDTLRQWGRGCTKSLKKLINEAGVPLSARDRLAVLADNDQLIWAEGFGVRDSAALTIHTERALLIEMIGEEILPCTMTSNAY